MANPQTAPVPPTIGDNKAQRHKIGGKIEVQLIIGAGIAAAGIITALLLRWQDDPLEEDIRAAMQYESKQQKIAKAIRR